MSSRPSIFAPSYKQGREQFLSLCRRKNLPTKSYIHPDYRGPEGEELAIDTTWIGPRNASRVLMQSCGTHGLEASTGSALMCHWLSGLSPEQLPPDVAVLLVHAVNPYGWAYTRRGNEHGIDLNRNFLKHRLKHPRNTAYDDLHTLITSVDPSEQGLQSFHAAFQHHLSEVGYATVVNGLSAGQYDYPDGLSYGGQTLSWSCRTFYALAMDYLHTAEKVIHIDWHTGIGAFGQPYFILDEDKTSPANALCQKWWPTHDIHSEDVVDGLQVDYTGILLTGLKRALTNALSLDFVSLTIEWGTYDIRLMIEALLMDNWLVHRRANASKALVSRTCSTLIDRFCPSDPDWKQSVLTQSGPLITGALDGLKHWK